MAKNSNIPSFDDLIFESRNREYGAYQLRKRYNLALVTGITAGTLLACAVVLIPFLFKPDSEEFIIGGGSFVSLQMENLDPPEEDFYVPAPPPERTQSAQEVVKYVPPEVVDTIINIANLIPATDEVLARAEGDAGDFSGPGFGDELFEGEGGYDGDEPFILVEVMPSFRGGDINKFRDYIQKRTNYPQEALDRKIQGRVFLTFIIETNGSVSNVTVVKGVDPIIDNEAVKAIQSSPSWSPGLQRGQPVRVRYSMWLSFII
ncbi:MAG: energy transducer TonB [Bacteroidota bacterium]